jgi:hypothetical protein
MDMKANKISGEIVSNKTIGRTIAGMLGREKHAGAESGKSEMTGKKKFPIGWLLAVAALSFFLGLFWSYIPVVRGIVSLFVISKFCGTQFLL